MGTERGSVIVTGAASGIGEACARSLAECGYRVLLVDKESQPTKDIADQVGGVSFQLDITEEQAVRDLLQTVKERWGIPTGLVTSAGITHNPASPEDMSLEEWQTVMTVDVQGTWLPAKVFGEAMAKSGGGNIVTVSSVAGLRSTPLHAYGPAKAAVIQITENLATQWGRSGVRVNGVAPGYTLTPLLETRIQAGHRDPRRMKENSALGRLVTREEVAATVEFLLSEKASAITGVTIPVDAGWLTMPPWSTYQDMPKIESVSMKS